jgi:uncharacterized protein YdeI (YjbR/CyaY-like superfamily)
MGKKDPRVDSYIAQSADFAKPILSHLRTLVHAGCPDIEEGVKWGFPHFMYKGILCSMASFKYHCAFGFWKGQLILGKGNKKAEQAMGHFGRIASLKDLPADKTIISYVKKAMELNDAGVKAPTRVRSTERKRLVVPHYFKFALQKNKKALATFEGFNYSSKKDYVTWVVEAKTEETRAERLNTAIEWMAEGKIRNWKYAR